MAYNSPLSAQQIFSAIDAVYDYGLGGAYNIKSSLPGLILSGNDARAVLDVQTISPNVSSDLAIRFVGSIDRDRSHDSGNIMLFTSTSASDIGASDQGFQWFLSGSGTGIRINDGTGAPREHSFDNITFNDNHEWVVSFDNETGVVDLYRDGSLIRQVSGPVINWNSNLSHITVGNDPISNIRNVYCDIKQLQIFQQALSSDDVRNLAHDPNHIYSRDWNDQINILPGDIYPPLVSYSLRPLSAGFKGNVVRVRRDSDEAETDFTSAMIVSGGLTQWVNLSGVASGFVTTWYDQSGNEYHATQTDTLVQPRIVSGGEIITNVYGAPAIDFQQRSGNYVYLDIPSLSAATIYDDVNILSIFIVQQPAVPGTLNSFIQTTEGSETISVSGNWTLSPSVSSAPLQLWTTFITNSAMTQYVNNELSFNVVSGYNVDLYHKQDGQWNRVVEDGSEYTTFAPSTGDSVIIFNQYNVVTIGGTPLGIVNIPQQKNVYLQNGTLGYYSAPDTIVQLSFEQDFPWSSNTSSITYHASSSAPQNSVGSDDDIFIHYTSNGWANATADAPSTSFVGKVNEVIFFDDDILLYRRAIQDNINSYYTIYNSIGPKASLEPFGQHLVDSTTYKKHGRVYSGHANNINNKNIYSISETITTALTSHTLTNALLPYSYVSSITISNTGNFDIDGIVVTATSQPITEVTSISAGTTATLSITNNIPSILSASDIQVTMTPQLTASFNIHINATTIK